jgi:DNA replication protein
MMTQQQRKNSFSKGLLAGMNQGTVSIPHLLIKYYPRLKLSDMETMLLIHILAFKEKEEKDFPTIEELQSRMSSDPELVIDTLQKLMKQGFLTIDEAIDPLSGIQYENYNLQLTFEKLAMCYADELEEMAQESKSENQKQTENKPSEQDKGKNIFTTFEKEFARPLSPMECETISSWIDQDSYTEELILTALKEAVFAGKLHFRYIDRILLEWSRNRIHTAEQAKEYTQKFRGSR